MKCALPALLTQLRPRAVRQGRRLARVQVSDLVVAAWRPEQGRDVSAEGEAVPDYEKRCARSLSRSPLTRYSAVQRAH